MKEIKMIHDVFDKKENAPKGWTFIQETEEYGAIKYIFVIPLEEYEKQIKITKR